MSNDKRNPRYLTLGDAKEIIESMLRQAMREQARELEGHLNSLHERIRVLEATTRR